jgi:phytoene dehydrogenase-like protein
VLLHHVMGSAGGARGVWGYVQGGMGALSEAIARSGQERGVEVRLNSPAAHILVEGGRTVGVQLESGERIHARTVASCVDPHLTFEKLLDGAPLPDEFRQAVRRIDYSSASMKINLAVSELPNFACLPNGVGIPEMAGGPKSQPPATSSVGAQHRGTIHIGCTLEYLERAFDDAKYGRPSEHPMIEMTIPTSVDSTLTPPGHHILSLFVQYAPYQLASGSWDEIKESFADRCVAEIARYAPNVPASILHRHVISPVDLERTYGLTGGNIFQGAVSLHQLFSMRPVPGWSDYRTPVQGLYMCGSAAHPGGGVTGACGKNAAREILRDS